MFDSSFPGPAALAEASDRELTEAITGWSSAAAAAQARMLAAVAERRRRAETADAARQHWACDPVDEAAAQISCALTVSHGRALALMDTAVVLGDHLPRLNARFLAGQVSERVVARIVWLCALVVDEAVWAQLDEQFAAAATSWGTLSGDKLDTAITVWIHTLDPDAVRRARSAQRSRDFRIGARADTPAATTTVYGRITSIDAAIAAARLTAMVNSVCPADPRTMAQKRADAFGAVFAGAFHLRCLCAQPDCLAATVPDARATSVVVHVVTDTTTLTTTPDPTLHGTDDPDPQPDTEPETEPQPSAEPEPVTQPSPEPQPVAEPAATPAPHAQSSTAELRPTPSADEPEADPEPVAEPAVAPSPNPEPSTAELRPTPSADPNLQPSLNVEPEAEAEPDPEADPKRDVHPEPPTERGPEPPSTPPDPVTRPGPLTPPRPAVILGACATILTPDLLAEVLTHGATIRHLTDPRMLPIHPGYRPTTAQDEYVRCRDLTCRVPGCDRPAVHVDLDHSNPWPAGPTHPSNLNGKCRLHHLLKTFWEGWTEHQQPDGTLHITTPTGHTYTTKPFSTLLLPSWTTTADPPPPTPPPPATPPRHHPRRASNMPLRRRTRAQNRATYITQARAHNAIQAELDRAAEEKAAEQRQAQRQALRATSPRTAAWADRQDDLEALMQSLNRPSQRRDDPDDPPPF